jgi:single-strand DNA-binding protein
MYQKTVIIGRLGRDPEMRYTQDGTPVCSFSVATDRRWKDASGQAIAKTTWFRVTTWRNLAEVVNQYTHKGDLVMCEGELAEPKPYQKTDGTWAASLDLTASAVKFLNSKRDSEHAEPADGAEMDIPF